MTETARYQVLDRAPRTLADRLLRWETILCLLLAAVIVVNALGSPYFLDLYNLSDMTQNFSEKAIIALGMALLILTREIDLSVAAIVALASLAIGYGAQAGYGPAILVAIGLGVGIVCGAFNGWLVTGFGLPSIVVTIGTMSLYRGIAQVVLGDQAITTYPEEYTNLAQLYIVQEPPLYLAFILFLVLAVVFTVVLHFTVWGRMLYAIGNNPVAARFSGIPVNRIRFLIFVLTGLLSGLASALLTAQYRAGLGARSGDHGGAGRHLDRRRLGYHAGRGDRRLRARPHHLRADADQRPRHRHRRHPRRAAGGRHRPADHRAADAGDAGIDSTRPFTPGRLRNTFASHDKISP